MPDSGGQSETAEIPTDKDESETPEPSDSGIEETPSPEVPEEMPDTDSTDEPPAEEVPAEETPVPEESPLPDDEEAFSVSEAILEYGYAYAAAYAESVIYEDADLTAPLFTLKEDGGVLLITEETETAFKVWWLTYADEPLSGYIAKSDIADISFSEEARQTLKEQRPCGFITSDIGYMDAFVLFGELTISAVYSLQTPIIIVGANLTVRPYNGLIYFLNCFLRNCAQRQPATPNAETTSKITHSISGVLSPV